MLWDGDCGFCQRWVEKWRKTTGEKVLYLPCQFFATQKVGNEVVLKDFPEISVRDCERSVQLVLSDGRRYQAAAAVFCAFYESGRKKFLWRAYEYLPGFKPLAELAYKFIAGHRGWF